MDLMTSIRFAASRQPSAIAVAENDQRLAYAELVERCDALGTGLLRLGVAPGDRVVLPVANSLDAVVALFGVLAAGATPVPVNFRTRSDALGAILNATGASAVVVDEHSADSLGRIRSWSGQRITLNDADVTAGAITLDEVAAQSASAATLPQSPSDGSVAMILLTSGSTGDPKQIPLTHRQCLARVHGLFMNHGFRHADDLRTLGLMPIYHTVGLHGVLLLSVLSGGTYYPVRKFDSSKILQLIAREQVTYLFATPTMFTRLVDQPSAAFSTNSVAHAMYAGAAMAPTLVRTVARVVTDNFTHIYGNTETFNSLFFRSAADCPGALQPGAQHRIKIASTRKEGTEAYSDDYEGELLVDMASDEAFDGYLDPLQTAERITDGWYHTGDIAMRDSEGRIFILGRADDLITTGGENVYPAETESVIMAHPSVTDCAVVGIPDATWGQVVAALVVSADTTLTERDLLDYCRDQHGLESFRRPRVVRFLDAIPTSASGKRSRAELRSLLSSAPSNRVSKDVP